MKRLFCICFLFSNILFNVPGFAADNPYDKDITLQNLDIDKTPQCGRGIYDSKGSVICPVLDAGTMTKVALSQVPNEGQYWLVWKAYWVNHRPILFSLTAALVFQPDDSSKPITIRTVYAGTENGSGGDDLWEAAPDLFFIGISGNQVSVRQIFLAASANGKIIKTETNLPLFKFNIK